MTGSRPNEAVYVEYDEDAEKWFIIGKDTGDHYLETEDRNEAESEAELMNAEFFNDEDDE